MKRIAVILFLINPIFGQEPTSLSAWKNIFQSPNLVNYFDGVFNSLGLTIEEDGKVLRFIIVETGLNL